MRWSFPPQPSGEGDLPMFDDQSGDRLPAISTKQWVDAFKMANITYHRRPRRICLRPMQPMGLPYPMVAQATCLKQQHRSPQADCQCGFNAFAEQPAALAYVQGASSTQLINKFGFVMNNLVLVQVGLRGRVFEGMYPHREYGYRAEWQEVGAILVPTSCRLCEESVPSAVLGTQPGPEDGSDGRYLYPLCANHALQADVRLTLEEAADLADVEFAWQQA